MIQKIKNAQEFYVIFRKALPVQVLFLDQEKVSNPEAIQSTVDKLQNHYKKDAVNFYSADTSDSKLCALANLYQTDGLPTMLVFKRGQLQDEFSGSISKRTLADSLA
ncbi:MAG: thioredoxin family protein [Bacteroidota bacterium]